jgi:DNA-binding winged helix-turn-helix (wHTH) protein
MADPARAATAADLVFPPYRIDADVDLLYRDGAVVPLEPRAVQVLRALAARAGRVVGKRELLAAVWPGQAVTDDVLKRAVAKARRALGDAAAPGRYIETFHARGYRFAAAAGPAALPPPPAADPRTELALLAAALRSAVAEARGVLAEARAERRALGRAVAVARTPGPVRGR